MKRFIVYYRSRYYPLEGLHKMRVTGTSKKQIRADFFELVQTDEYRVVRIDEEK